MDLLSNLIGVHSSAGKADLKLGPFSKVGFQSKFVFRIREHFLVTLLLKGIF